MHQAVQIVSKSSLGHFKLICLVEREILLMIFKSLSAFDEIILLDIYPARECLWKE
jgi:hypothetical protein